MHIADGKGRRIACDRLLGNHLISGIQNTQAQQIIRFAVRNPGLDIDLGICPPHDRRNLQTFAAIIT